ncbi:MAG: aminoglycoside 6-adenylyltransferase [bacterium]
MIPKLHQEFLDKAIQILKNDLRIVGIAAGGSYITNSMDEFSDIDLVIAIYPNKYKSVMEGKFEIAKQLGEPLAMFTGEHVGEPRLLICLFGPPLIHVDLKFVSLEDIENRVEDPVVLWERDNLITDRLKLNEAKFPLLNLQWIEDRFWVWIHYVATKIGRGEIFEAIEFISFLRQNVIGPLLLLKNGKLPRGVRKIEFDAKTELPVLLETIPTYDVQSCVRAIRTLIGLYLDLRTQFKEDGFVNCIEAEKYSVQYLNKIVGEYSNN